MVGISQQSYCWSTVPQTHIKCLSGLIKIPSEIVRRNQEKNQILSLRRCHTGFYLNIWDRTTHDALLHSALKRCARGLECTQHSVHSKSWALKCIQHSVHSKQWALGTQCHSPYRHWVLSACIVCGPMCPWAPPTSLGISLSLSVPHLGLALPRSSRLCLSLRRPKAYRNLRARTGISVVPRLKTQKKKSDPNNRKVCRSLWYRCLQRRVRTWRCQTRLGLQPCTTVVNECT